MPHITGLSTWLTLALVILVWPVFFTLLWWMVVFSIAAAGGWRRLAQSYRAAEPPIGGRVVTGVSGMVGWISYNRVIKVTIVDTGIFIALPWIFRPAHPSLFIPWRDIHNAHRTNRKFFMQYVIFDVGSPRIAGMRLTPAAFDHTPVFIN